MAAAWKAPIPGSSTGRFGGWARVRLTFRFHSRVPVTPCLARPVMASSSPVAEPLVYILTGVSGSGKSTVGHALANALACPFYDGDDFHPDTNREKMESGVPLSDTDRWPWLDRLSEIVDRHKRRGEKAVLACSALKKSYRCRLVGLPEDGSHRDEDVAFVLLQPTQGELEARLQKRAIERSHFFPPSLLDSQLNTLERDATEFYAIFEATVGGAMLAPDEIVAELLRMSTE